MLMGPSIYLYLKLILNREIRFRSAKTLLHILPVLPSIVYNIYFITLPVKERIDLSIENFETGIWQTDILNGIFYIQMSTYLIVGYMIIRKQLKVTSKVQLNSTIIDISWLRTYLIINILIMGFSAPLSFYFANEKTTIIIGQLAMVIQFVYIFIKSAWQSAIFQEDTMTTAKCRETALKITDEIAEEYYNNIIKVMDNDKPYLQENCTIQLLSIQTGIPLHHISNILNNRLEMNFSDFINGYRIETAKNILRTAKYEKMTIEAIGFDCGFGSKSSFNKAFKKYTSLTPSEFRRQNSDSND